MKNRQLVISLIVFLFSAGMVFFPSRGFTQEVQTIEGMVQIERNHLYMISVGAESGVSKGDIIEIYRIGVKVAEARLISVLSDSSMAELTKFINVTSVFESDTVHYIPTFKAKSKATLSSERRPSYDYEVEISDHSRARQKRGLLGSDTFTNRQIVAARAPLQKEVKGLREGMEVLQEEYEGKVEAMLNTVAAGKAKSVVALEKKWRKKYDASIEEYEEQLTVQRIALEEDYTGEKEGLEKRIEALIRQMSEAGEVGDKRIRQLLSDVKNSDATVNLLRETFEQERTLEEGRWAEKIADLERKYQNQLRIQRGDYKRRVDYTNKVMS